MAVVLTTAIGAGTGLGLSQVFGFTKQSNGVVSVASTLGAGATYKLSLHTVAAPSGDVTAAPSGK